MSLKLPSQIEVKSVTSNRYDHAGFRPFKWEDRVDGVDEVVTTDGQSIRLLSSGQQSTPSPGWSIILTGGEPRQGYTWTLYGLPQGVK